MVDIDGVISLFGCFRSSALPAPHCGDLDGSFHTIDGIPHFLSRAAAGHLLLLARDFDLVWCSGWEEKADEHLPYALGLPSGLPHLSFAPAGASSDRHWKLDAIDRFAGPVRPLAWIDDAHDETCARWAAERAAPTLLVATEPAVGLTAAHADQLSAWAARL